MSEWDSIDAVYIRAMRVDIGVLADAIRDAAAQAGRVCGKIVIDDTCLLEAAEALQRELAAMKAHLVDEDEAPDAVSALEDTIERLLEVAAAAKSGPLRIGPKGWPGVEIVVQGVA